MRLAAAHLLLAFALASCSGGTGGSGDSAPSVDLTLEFSRPSGTSAFRATATLKRDGSPLAGQTLTTVVPKGTASAVVDNGDGTYAFTVTPSVTGEYPVQVSFGSASASHTALVLDSYGGTVGQPVVVEGDVNTEGYEDGITITPDGQYLFVQYGPFSMSGLLYLNTICSSGVYSAGYDLNTCDGRTNSSLVFDTRGPMTTPLRPGFPTGGISGSKLLHLPSLIIGGVANGIAGFPTAFYGFKRQADGSFRQPFKVAFNDARGLNGPFGLSFRLNGDGTATFAVAWDNYFNHLGDDKPDVYSGTLTLGQDKDLGDVTYSGEFFASITPTISPVNFPSHAGVQGNPHLYSDNAGVIQSIWTDDEQVSHDLSVYRLTAGVFPSGTWVKETLPSPINTVAKEFQPFFTGTQLIFTRDSRIVAHAYRPTNGACASTYTHAHCWGPESVLVSASGHTSTGEIANVGEPTIAIVNGKKYLYFVYIKARSTSNAVTDFDANAAYVEIQ